jgi:Stigma-specific protein, Stig1
LRITTVAIVVCALGLLCAEGACDSSGSLGSPCPAGATLCGSRCSNLQGDPDNCGACGTVCAHGSLCDLGACTSAGFDAGLPAEAAAPASDASKDAPADAPADVSPESSNPGIDASSDAPLETSTITDSGQEGQ